MKRATQQIKRPALYWVGYALLFAGILGFIAFSSALFLQFCEPKIDERAKEIGAQVDEYRKSLEDSSSVEDLKGDLVRLYRLNLITQKLHSDLILSLGFLGVAAVVALVGGQVMISARSSETIEKISLTK
jgi:hypothetical protein